MRRISDFCNLSGFILRKFLRGVVLAFALCGVGLAMANTLPFEESVKMAISNYPKSVAKKVAKLEELQLTRQKSQDASQTIDAISKLVDHYLIADVDSALIYLNLLTEEAESSGDEVCAFDSYLRYNSYLPLKGVVFEPKQVFEDIEVSRLDDSRRGIYLKNLSRLYINISRAYPEGVLRQHYVGLSRKALEELKVSEPAGSLEASYLDALNYYYAGQLNLSAAMLMDLLPSLKEIPRMYFPALMIVSRFYKDKEGYQERYLNFLAEGVIESLNMGVIDPMIVSELGEALISSGETSLGNECIEFVLEVVEKDATASSQMSLKKYFSLRSYVGSENRFIGGIIALVAVIAFLVVLVVIGLNKYRKVRTQMVLSQEEMHRLHNTIPEMRRCLLELALMGNRQVKELLVLVERKLAVGQSKDLYVKIQEGRLARDAEEKFFEAFDEAVLGVFPEFPQDMNVLFLPDKILTLPENRRLTPELRIAAFMRLGITDANEISKVLGLSLNTIYTYRNRLVSRAVNREEFKQKMQNFEINNQ